MLGRTNSTGSSTINLEVTNGIKRLLPSLNGETINPLTFVKITNGTPSNVESDLMISTSNTPKSNPIIIPMSNNRFFICIGLATGTNSSAVRCQMFKINDDDTITKGTAITILSIDRNNNDKLNAVLVRDNKIFIQAVQYNYNYSMMLKGSLLSIDNLTITEQTSKAIFNPIVPSAGAGYDSNVVVLNNSTLVSVTIMYNGSTVNKLQAATITMTDDNFTVNKVCEIYSGQNMSGCIEHQIVGKINDDTVVVFNIPSNSYDTDRVAIVLKISDNLITVQNTFSHSLTGSSVTYDMFLPIDDTHFLIICAGKAYTYVINSDNSFSVLNTQSLPGSVYKDGNVFWVIPTYTTTIQRYYYNNYSFTMDTSISNLQVRSNSFNYGKLAIYKSTTAVILEVNSYSSPIGISIDKTLIECVTPATSSIQGIVTSKCSAIPGEVYIAN